MSSMHRCFNQASQFYPRLVVIVLIFIICHAYRLALKIYEFANPSYHTAEHFEHCSEHYGRYGVPVTFLVLLSTSDIFLVFNSSINFVIYCCVGKEFRHSALKLFTRVKN